MTSLRISSIHSTARILTVAMGALSCLVSCGADADGDESPELPSAYSSFAVPGQNSQQNPAINSNTGVGSANGDMGASTNGGQANGGQANGAATNGAATGGGSEGQPSNSIDANQGQNAQGNNAGNQGAGGASMGNAETDSNSNGAAGAPMNGGAAGAAMNGGNQDPVAGGAGCDGAAFFCEDFESLATGPLAAGINGMTPERTVNVINEPGRGLVLQAQAGRGYNGKAGIFLNDFSAPNNAYYGRMYVNVDVFAKTDNDHWVIVEATGTGAATSVRPVGGQFEKWAPGSDGDASGDWTDHDGSQAFTQDGVWTCVEWQMNGANGANEMTLWADGVEVRRNNHGGFTIPNINRLWIGWVVYQDGRQPTAFDARFDDIVLSTERVGCN